MFIKNVGIFVKDLEGAKDFFADYFNAKVLKTIDNDATNYHSYVMILDDGAWLELMAKPETVDIDKNPNRLGYAHICIETETRAQLDEIVARLKAAGYTFQYEPDTPTGLGDARLIACEDLVIEVYFPG